jgi:hypothetical protein
VQEPKALLVESFDFDPKTAAEQSVYTIELKPQTVFDESCTVNVEFPNAYNKRLSPSGNIACYSEKLSKKDDFSLECGIDERLVTIKDTKGWSDLTDSFVLTLSRVVNPLSSAVIDPFKIFTQCGLEHMDYIEHAASITLSTPPSIMWIKDETDNNEILGNVNNIDLTVDSDQTLKITDNS